MPTSYVSPDAVGHAGGLADVKSNDMRDCVCDWRNNKAFIGVETNLTQRASAGQHCEAHNVVIGGQENWR